MDHIDHMDADADYRERHTSRRAIEYDTIVVVVCEYVGVYVRIEFCVSSGQSWRYEREWCALDPCCITRLRRA